MTLSNHLNRTPTLAFAMLLCLIILIAGCSSLDEHRTITKKMGWQCIGTRDTADQRFPHIEAIKMWYLENPRYEERASGPHLCSELAASEERDVAVTFDVWGSSLNGVHGYNMTAIAIGGRQLKIYGSESGGYHDDTVRSGDFNSAADEKLHPELYHFPLDVFRWRSRP